MSPAMGLSSLHLDAFFAAAQSLNFSVAAKELHITQSALSQRIKSLEEELDLTLFMRMPRGVQLTEAGQTLLRYCQARFSLEQELLMELTGKAAEGLGGMLRVGGYSSVVRSVVLPALAPLLRANPNIQTHLQNDEMRLLPELLLTGQVDFIILDTHVHRADLEVVELGQEEYVMVESSEHPVDRSVYLDHDPNDTITQQFLSMQSAEVPDYKRAFLDEIYAIIDGVAMGLGRAVVSKHLVIGNPRVRVISSHRSMFVPVLLHFHKQPFFTELHKAVIQELRERCPPLLRPEG
jgi:DNA-binding transcriptional LysR family regulator